LSIVPDEGDQLAQIWLPATEKILRSISNIYKNLKSGVTIMRIMGEEYDIDIDNIDLKEAISEEIISGPRLFVSGKGGGFKRTRGSTHNGKW